MTDDELDLVPMLAAEICGHAKEVSRTQQKCDAIDAEITEIAELPLRYAPGSDVLDFVNSSAPPAAQYSDTPIVIATSSSIHNVPHPTILVIDDDPAVYKSLEFLLESEGYQVVVACNGRKGIATYPTVIPDLVITDIIMPEATGLTVIAEIKRINPIAKIIAMSGGGRIGNTNFLETARELGAETTIAKPFDPEELLGAVRALLASDPVVAASGAT